MPRHRIHMLVLACLLIPATLHAQDAETADDVWDLMEVDGGSESRPVSVGKPNADVDKLVQFYLRLYGKQLKSKDWTTRAMSVLSLGRLADERVTDTLLDVLHNDKDPYVRAFAWETLHARNPLLSEGHRRRWTRGGLQLDLDENVLRGRLRTGLIRSIRPLGPTDRTRKLWLRTFVGTNLLYAPDLPVLLALRRNLATWRDPDLIRQMILALGHPDHCYRAEFVLRGLGAGLPTAEALHDSGSELRGGWKALQQEYAHWQENRTLEPFDPDRADPYTGRSELLKAPRSIRNPNDPTWRRDLELPDLRVDALSVAFVVDSTASMHRAIDWLRADLLRMMQALKLLSREPAIGVTLYRDRGEEYLVRMHRMTRDARKLTRVLARTTAKGGGDYPEAVYEAVYATLDQHPWLRGHKVIVLVGDAPPHRDTMASLKQLITRGVEEKNLRAHCLKVFNSDWAKAASSAEQFGGEVPLDPSETFDQIARWGKGKSIEANFFSTKPAVMYSGVQVPVSQGFESSTYREILAAIFMSCTNEAYHDRAKPLVTVLLECLERSPKEKRIYKTGAEYKTIQERHERGRLKKNDTQRYRQKTPKAPAKP